MVSAVLALMLLASCNAGKKNANEADNVDVTDSLCEEEPIILAPVCISGKWGFINKNGKYVINPQFDKVGYFHCGLAAVRINNNNGYYSGYGRWGFINADGEYVVNPQFDEVHRFYEGVAAVKRGEKWGFIDEWGGYVAEPQYDKVEDFSEGLARVYIAGRSNMWGEYEKGRWGFIDKTGSYVINPQFDEVGSFRDVMKD